MIYMSNQLSINEIRKNTLKVLIIPPPNEVDGGGGGGLYWNHLVRLSVCLSVRL